MSAQAKLDPSVRKRIGEATRKRMADPSVRKRMSDAIRKRMADPSVRKRIGEATRKRMADPSVRKRIGEGRKSAWARERKLRPELRDARAILRSLKGAITRRER